MRATLEDRRGDAATAALHQPPCLCLSPTTKNYRRLRLLLTATDLCLPGYMNTTARAKADNISPHQAICDDSFTRTQFRDPRLLAHRHSLARI